MNFSFNEGNAVSTTPFYIQPLGKKTKTKGRKLNNYKLKKIILTTERERERERETDRQTHRDRQTETDRDTERVKCRACMYT